MKMIMSAIAMSAALVATDASAQVVNLTGRYRCVEMCAPSLAGQFGYITQNGWEMNIVNDAGEASRAWLDYPGRIWVQRTSEQNPVEPGVIDLLRHDGRYIGSLRGQELPGAVSPGGLAAYITRDEMDIEQVVVRRLPADWR